MLAGVVQDASYLGVSTQYLVETRGGARVTVYEQNVERATKAELWARGDEVRLYLVAGSHLRRRVIVRGCGSRGRVMKENPMAPEPLAAPVSRRAVLKGTALAGVAAFLAACTGAKASPSPSTAPASASSGPVASATPVPASRPRPRARRPAR